MNKSMALIALLAGLVLMCAQGAYADVTVVYKMISPDGGGIQTIHYADKQHVRMDMTIGTNRTMSMMKLGDKVYSITGKVVQDMSQLSAMMSSMGVAKKSSHKTLPPIKFEATGKTEIIAGLRGKVYRFKEKGKSHEVVLGDNKDLHAATSAAVAISKSMIDMMPFGSGDQVQQDASMKGMAMLRLDNNIRLQSINTRAIPAATFALPSKPQQMGGMGGLMKRALGH